jgi:cobalt-zinc-cadmium efflux system protein
MAHDHGHSHDAVPVDFGRAFIIGIVLNLGFVAIELSYGLLVDSLALIADAGHNFSDVIGLVLAFGATLLARRLPSKRRTYGLKRATILASLLSAVLLLVALGGIVWEAAARFSSGSVIDGKTVMIVAGIGVVINTATALLFISGQKQDLNIRGAYLHMAADAGVSLGVVLAGMGMIATGWTWLDPAISLVIVAIILIGTWRLLTESLNLTMDAVPEGIVLDDVRDFLTGLDGVVDLHDLHVWALSTTETALTAHLVMESEEIDKDFLNEASDSLSHEFEIAHVTLQLETADTDESCSLDRVVCT